MARWQENFIETSVNEFIDLDQINLENVIPKVFQLFAMKITKILQQELLEEPGKDFAELEKLLERACKSSADERLSLLNSAVCTSPDKPTLDNALHTRRIHIKDSPNLFPHYKKLATYRRFFNCNHERAELPDLDQNDSFPYASKSLKVIRTEEMGRHVVSASEISRGDVLFSESPVACAVLAEYERDYCHHCCRRLYDIVPCDGCATVAYCCIDCKEAGWEEYHCFECRFVKFLESMGIAYLALRSIISVGSYDQLVGQVEHLVLKSQTYGESDVHIARGYEALFDLEFHYDDLDSSELAYFGLVRFSADKTRRVLARRKLFCVDMEEVKVKSETQPNSRYETSTM